MSDGSTAPDRGSEGPELVVLCPHFRPDVAPTGEVMSTIAEHLVARGARLHIITALPWYLHHRVEEEWTGSFVAHEDREWGRITRVHPFPTDKTNIPARAVGFAGFTALTTVLGLAIRHRVDAVLAMSPPITLGLAGLAVARRHRVPFVFNIQDVFPDVAIELGVLSSPRIIATARALERTLYRRADAVTVLSDDLADNVRTKLGLPSDGSVDGGPPPVGRGSASTAVRVIPNFVDTERIRPTRTDNTYRKEFDLLDRIVVMYAGNVGMSQSLELVLDAAAAFAHRPEVVFVINGGGAALEGLVGQAERRGLTNVRFVGLQPADRLADVLAAADVHVVALRRGLARSSVPSKLYSILAAGRPVLASVDVGTEVARVVDEVDAGIAVPPEDPTAFIEGLRVLLDDAAGRRRRGANGRAFVEDWASPRAVAGAYLDLFAELIAARSAR